MNEKQIPFQVGDQVIHWAHGPGVIIQLDDKTLSGHTRQYYVVQMSDLTLWVPIDQAGDRSLRLPTSKKDFISLFQILTSSGKPLSSDRNERRLQVVEQLKDHELASICRVIRDLTLHKRLKKMNENDNSTLERNRNFLINEWSVALSIPIQQAEQELRNLLEGDENIS
ncbi:MAG: CarD family transcriptional regulator [Anaerolineales bacterium]